MSDEMPILWYPDVCQCVLRQSRDTPESVYAFENKCFTHANLDDAEARKAIIQLCADKTLIITGVRPDV